MKNAIILLAVVLLASCSSTPEKVTQDKTRVLDENHGYVLIGVDLNRQIHSLEIEGVKDYLLTHEDLKRGTSYFLFALPSGQYSFTNVRLNKWSGYQLVNDMWDFEIENDKISYVGHLHVKSSGAFFYTNTEIQLKNQSSQALLFLENEFPNILNNRKVRYRGPGTDKFFELVEKLNFEESSQ